MASRNNGKEKPKPKPGDMIEFPRGAGYSHFGTYVGGGKVIHATSDFAASGSVIRKEPVEKVATNGNYKVSNQDKKKTPLSPETIVSQAEKRVGEAVRYNPITYNCETVASEFRYGKGHGHSEQGEKIKKSLVKTGEDFLRDAKDTYNTDCWTPVPLCNERHGDY